jgi:hypothetical protein
MLTQGLITTPFPILAPKILSSDLLKALETDKEFLKKKALRQIQRISISQLLPLENSGLEKENRDVFPLFN